MNISPAIQTVSSLDMEELQPYRTLRRQEEHKKQGIFVAEGDKVVQRLLDSGLPVVSLLATKERYARLPPSNRQPPTYPVFIADQKLIETIAGLPLHQGIMAVGRLPKEHPLEDLVRKLPQPLFIAALDGISQSENVGTIVRNCAAFGVQIVISGETSCSPYLRRAVRNSMGTVFTLEVVHSPNLFDTLQMLKQQYSTSVIAADAHSDTSLETLNLSGNLCVVFGSEDAGVSPPIMDQATHVAAIPMRDGVDSLNVGSASAVVLYELSRRQKQKQ